MLEIILIFVIALMPLLISLLLLRKAKQRWQARLRQMRNFRQRQSIPPPSSDRFEIANYFIGDITCRYNARSPHFRCAVNPDGPCEGCRHYEARD